MDRKIHYSFGKFCCYHRIMQKHKKRKEKLNVIFVCKIQFLRLQVCKNKFYFTKINQFLEILKNICISFFFIFKKFSSASNKNAI